jgi:ATPase family protein associated with various cellular activities (AAA)/winged helix domain-containing protein
LRVLPVNVVVAATAPDIEAEAIAAAVAERSDMRLVSGCVLQVAAIDALVDSLFAPCAVVLIGPDADTEEPADRFLLKCPDCVVMRVTAPHGDLVRIARHGPSLQDLLGAVRALVDHSDVAPRVRVAHFRPRIAAAGSETITAPGDARRDGAVLGAAIKWIHAILRNAVAGLANGSGDLPGLTVTATTVVAQLDATAVRTAADTLGVLREAEDALTRALAQRDNELEPLARITRALALSDLELRLLLLALAPELDARYQRCIGVLMDDLGRRVGTLGLYASLLGEPTSVRLALSSTGHLIRWRVLDLQAGLLPAADEPLRVDPCLVAWVLGDPDAVVRDPRVRRATRLSAWPGTGLIEFESERLRAATLVGDLQANDRQWRLFAGDDAAGWRALLELGAELRQAPPIRVEGARLAGLDPFEIEESALRFGRAVRLTGAPLIVDVTSVGVLPEADEALRLLFAAIAATGCCASVVCPNAARIVRLLGSISFVLMEGPAVSPATRADAFRAAARFCGAPLSAEEARSLVSLHPLQIDGFERAMAMARSVQAPDPTAEARFDHFVSACKQVAAEALSRLAERIEPVFSLDDVVLPADRMQQLHEIVDNVRLADRVLEGWQFSKQLPYGRGVTALLHGPSGTGKTMAALAVARRLGVQILRIDLSRVVSKYIGETEKNIDCVFGDARSSGAALLIDEADALLGKRSEVKDAHDRYANIEVAYLLQRMEAYDGLAIMTTNLRQNLDAAFLRRLRFIIDFPRPDTEAREEIWRRCLPEKSHTLDAATFRQLARKIDLTGGHIRQITLRAAFVAAANNKSIGLAHIAYAANAELAKLGRPPVALELPEDRKAA